MPCPIKRTGTFYPCFKRKEDFIFAPIRACNSLLIQPNPYFGAELNYYKSFRSAYDRSFETADYSAQTRAIGGAFDVNAAPKESIEFLTKNSFQSYME